MRILITLILFILTLFAIQMTDKEESRDVTHTVSEKVLPTEEYKSQLISYSFHANCMLPTDCTHGVHVLFKQSCQRYLQHIQFSIRENTQQLAKAIMYAARNRTEVSATLHKQGHTLEHRRQKKRYTYIIRHILI